MESRSWGLITDRAILVAPQWGNETICAARQRAASDFANRSKLRLLGSGKLQSRSISTSKTRTCKWRRFDRNSQNARLERRNASSCDEKIRTVTVPGQTLERGQGRTKSPRQSKNKTATGKSTKSVAIK